MRRVLESSTLAEGQVAARLGLSLADLKAWVRAGLVAPERDESGDQRFRSGDVERLEAAERLRTEGVSRRRVPAILDRFEELGGDANGDMRTTQHGHDVVARIGGRLWDLESGQTLLDFDTSREERKAQRHPALAATPVAEAPAEERRFRVVPFPDGSDLEDAVELCEQAAEAEAGGDSVAARALLRRAIATHPEHADAHLELGRLLHEAEELVAAEEHYREAERLVPQNPTAAFNLGLLYEDRGDLQSAATSYERAVACDPGDLESHQAALRVYESLGDRAAAMRVLKRMRALSKS